MPPPLHVQNVVAFVWDFDKTLIPSNMQDPIFEEYDVDPEVFWSEVEALPAHYQAEGVRIQRDIAYLGHLLTYVEAGVFGDLSNEKLRALGSKLEPAPGMPEFMTAVQDHVADTPEFAAEGIAVEHYIVSTGLREMIAGSVFENLVDGVWANTFVEHVAEPGFLDRLPVAEPPAPIKQLGYVIDNTSKTRALFEINKGVNVNPDIDVNARMSEDQRRVPMQNIIYVADGPSDVPAFSILNAAGGRTLGVYLLEPQDNYAKVKQLLGDSNDVN